MAVVALVVGLSPGLSNSKPSSQLAVVNADSELLWRAGHEGGNHREWNRITISGSADADIVNHITHNGNYANALRVSNGYGGVRMVVTDFGLTDDPQDPKNLPDQAYFSVWYYFPQKIDPSSNVFQWKQSWQQSPNTQTRRLLYWVRADWNDNQNAFNFHLKTKVNNANGEWDGTSRSLAKSSLTVPLNTWIHLECSYRWSKTGNGAITCWQDGTKIFDFDNLYTEYNWTYLRYPRQWTVNNYTGSYVTTPANHTIYVDDAAIATSRLGPRGPMKCGGLDVTILGTRGDDVIIGSDGPDVILGRGGNDRIIGGKGSDHICGGPGRDRIFGNEGPDVLAGGTGHDVVTGGPGSDIVNGGKGRDTLHGRGGTDEVAGAAGRDELFGGFHDDRLRGGPGLDACHGGPGDDEYESC